MTKLACALQKKTAHQCVERFPVRADNCFDPDYH
jgi:hypothetical protein